MITWAAISVIFWTTLLLGAFDVAQVQGLPRCNSRPRVAGLSASEKSATLDLHNQYRTRIRQGQIRGLPRAKHMPLLTWSQRLADEAQRWCNLCPDFKRYTHPPQHWPRFPHGQNMAWGQSSITAAVKGWFDEYKPYVQAGIDPRVFRGNGDPVVRRLGQIGHFTAMAAARTTQLGCGKVEGDVPYRVIYCCNYEPGGNVRHTRSDGSSFFPPVYEAANGQGGNSQGGLEVSRETNPINPNGRPQNRPNGRPQNRPNERPQNRPFGTQNQNRPFGGTQKNQNRPFGSQQNQNQPFGGTQRNQNRPFGSQQNQNQPFGSQQNQNRPFGGTQSRPGGRRPSVGPKGTKPFCRNIRTRKGVQNLCYHLRVDSEGQPIQSFRKLKPKKKGMGKSKKGKSKTKKLRDKMIDVELDKLKEIMELDIHEE